MASSMETATAEHRELGSHGLGPGSQAGRAGDLPGRVGDPEGGFDPRHVVQPAGQTRKCPRSNHATERLIDGGPAGQVQKVHGHEDGPRRGLEDALANVVMNGLHGSCLVRIVYHIF